MSTQLRFHELHVRPTARVSTMVLGRKSALAAGPTPAWLDRLRPSTWDAVVRSLTTGDAGDLSSTWVEGPPPVKWTLGSLPDACSRHNTPSRAHALTGLIQAAKGQKGDLQVVVALEDAEHARAAAAAVARAFPTYCTKTGWHALNSGVDVWLVPPAGQTVDVACAERAARAVRRAAELVDMPPNALDVPAFVQRAHEVAELVGAKIEVMEAEALRDRGFGGLWGVGKAAKSGPAMVVLEYAANAGGPRGQSRGQSRGGAAPPAPASPAAPPRTVVWVGKGIVYDTGGLSIKSKTGMPGMKRDMGGAAAVLHAFEAAALGGCADRLFAILCLAENAVGPDAIRPDDILHMYSGKTVEVNNTDAEGRLVLADGVAFAARHLEPDVIVDVATLTGAQLISTGKRHAAVVTNDEHWEQVAVQAGLTSGDLVFPLPFVPEFFRAEFASKVADMRNSVKDRANAQSSCAAQFIAEHRSGFEGPWVHVDMAGPAESAGVGTGYGVALLLEMFGYK